MTDTTIDARTQAGTVRGTWEDGLAVFKGVPFARPPVGTLRFAAPQAPEPWDGARPATVFGPPPPQSRVLGDTPNSAGDDWLTCNIWSPAPGDGALPVMVWIYGGAYLAGHAGDPLYSGARLARDGGVVVVTFNYRVAMEGFGMVQGSPANRGLLDQVAALTWAQENIAAFGGDPANVTVFGESAGAGSVAALLAMPCAAGLFHRAIAQSVPGTFFSPELAADIGAAVAAEAGVRPTTAELATVAPATLMAAADAVTASLPSRSGWGVVAHTATPFSPVVDGVMLPCTPWAALAAGSARGITLIAGHTRDEYRLFTAADGERRQTTGGKLTTAARALAPRWAAYRDAFPDTPPDLLDELVHSDWLFRMPSLRLAEAHAAGGGRAHLYELTWPAPGNGGALGACHALDVPLVFGNLVEGSARTLIGDDTAAAEQVSAAMRAAWTRFAACGDPGWPAYEPDGRLTQVFDSASSVLPYPEQASRLLWADHSFSELPLAAPRRPSALTRGSGQI